LSVQINFAGETLIGVYFREDYKEIIRSAAPPDGGRTFLWGNGEATLTRSPDGRAVLVARERATPALSIPPKRERTFRHQGRGRAVARSANLDTARMMGDPRLTEHSCSSIASCHCEGPITEPKAAASPLGQQPLFMRHITIRRQDTDRWSICLLAPMPQTVTAQMLRLR
jgi:hypothetical protein